MAMILLSTTVGYRQEVQKFQVMLSQLLPSQPRHNPFVWEKDRSQFWLPETLLDSTLDDGEDCESGLAWLELVEPLIAEGEQKEAYRALCQALSASDFTPSHLHRLMDTGLNVDVFQPLGLLAEWLKRELLSEPSVELFLLIADEHSDAESISQGDWRRDLREWQVASYAFLNRTRADLTRYFQELPTSIPFVGALLVECNDAADYLHILLELLEGQFRHGMEDRIAEGMPEQLEEDLLQSFEALARHIDEPNTENFRELESLWANWVMNLPLAEKGSTRLCRLCHTMNIAGRSRCKTCFLGVP
jgi:hypothetical protein